MEEQTKDQNTKKPMTDEERLKLAEKLDKDLDDYISGLEKKTYTEGWPEDKWEEEMEKHPFFMTEVPENGELPPLLHGIQQLKYDETENTPEELALSYKEDGNFNFKYKKYRMAVMSYTEGIRRHCGNNELEAQLYGNRAAAQIHLGNYRSAYFDCVKALKFVPNYLKAQVKAAECCVQLKKLDEAIDYCDAILKTKSTDPAALKLRTEAISLKKIEERNKRKEAFVSNKIDLELSELLAAVTTRGIKMAIADEDRLDKLRACQRNERPNLSNGELSWPVHFLYAEFMTSDLIEAFNENSVFYDHLQEVFATSPAWDRRGCYKPDTVNLYYKGMNPEHLYSLDVHSTLKEVLTRGRYVVHNWSLEFFALCKNSAAEHKFLDMHTLCK